MEIQVQQSAAGDGAAAADAQRLQLDAAVFGAAVKTHLLHAEVRRQLAARRAGTHATKNRSAVSGGGAKPWRQKGTGRARQGTNRAPQWAGGGAVFGPVPRSHAHKLNKKTRRAALRCALSLKAKEGALLVVDQLAQSEYKTKQVKALLQNLGVEESALLVLAAADLHFEKSARNLQKVGVLRAEGLNVYDVLRFQKLIIAKGALEVINRRLGDNRPPPPEAAAAPAEAAQ